MKARTTAWIPVVALAQMMNAATAFASTAQTSTPVLSAQQIEASALFGCAVINGRALCYGTGLYGELGVGISNSFPWAPTLSTLFPSNAVISQIATGYNHGCALVDGKASCWGRGDDGQLGKDSLLSALSPASSIAAGFFHTCALLSDNSVWCWGFNADGELGTNLANNGLTPVDLSELSGKIVGITAGAYHTCAWTTSSIYCWGRNNKGQLGEGLIQGTNVQNVSAGLFHTCAVIDGLVKCWGDNEFGQLGINSTPANLVAAGGGHTCAAQENRIQCWGRNDYGQLGDGNSTASTTPVDVLGISANDKVTAIVASNYGTCGIINGNVMCWGLNDNGQLGDGTQISSTTPVSIAAVEAFQAAQGVSSPSIQSQPRYPLMKKPITPAQISSLGTSVFYQSSNMSLADHVDWREAGIITPVKNQGQCASCWAFTTAAQLESAYMQATGQSIHLSEQQLVGCENSQHGFSDGGCDGGSLEQPLAYAKTGLCREEHYPYDMRDGSCQDTVCKAVVRVSSYTLVNPNDELALKEAVALHPVSIAVDASSSSFQLYKSGVLDDPSCGTTLNHTMLIVGYGEENGKKYWLCKNSWGEQWGDHGYIKIGRSESSGSPGICGIASAPAFGSVEVIAK